MVPPWKNYSILSLNTWNYYTNIVIPNYKKIVKCKALIFIASILTITRSFSFPVCISRHLHTSCKYCCVFASTFNPYKFADEDSGSSLWQSHLAVLGKWSLPCSCWRQSRLLITILGHYSGQGGPLDKSKRRVFPLIYFTR